MQMNAFVIDHSLMSLHFGPIPMFIVDHFWVENRSNIEKKRVHVKGNWWN